MEKHLVEAFEKLLLACKTHTAAAEFLGIDRQHYRRLRNGRVNIPQRTADYIILKAQEAGTDQRVPAHA